MVRVTTGLAIGLLALGGLEPAKAGQSPKVRYSERYEMCSSKAEGSYTLILGCLADEQGDWEAHLNREYRLAMRRSSAPDRMGLLRSERAWLKDRQRLCPLPADAGLSDLVDQRLCLLDETIRRTNWLKRH